MIMRKLKLTAKNKKECTLKSFEETALFRFTADIVPPSATARKYCSSRISIFKPHTFNTILFLRIHFGNRKLSDISI